MPPIIIKDAHDLSDGITFDDTLGIFYGTASPSIADTLNVPNGSVYLQVNGGVWHKRLGVWSDITLGGVSPPPPSAGAPSQVLLSDTRPLDEDGGTSRKEKWNVRSLNTINYDNGDVSIVGDDFILSSGTWRVEVFAPAYKAGKHKLRLVNESSQVTLIEGSTCETDKLSSAYLVGYVLSNGTDLLEIQHYTEDKKERKGLGEAQGIGTKEVYTQVKAVKVA